MAVGKVRKTGFTETTSKNYIVNAGTIYTNLTYDADEGFQGELHGATSGGVNVNIEIEYRNIEIDGAGWVELVGNRILQKGTASVTANMKEVTAETVRRSLNGAIDDATDEAPAGYKIVTSKRNLDDEDYLDNVAVVGTLSGTDEPVIIILDNALCTSGFNGEMVDDDEMVVEQTYEAHATYEQLVADEFPWRILFPTVS